MAAVGVALFGVASASADLLNPVTSNRFVSVTNRESAPVTTVSMTGPSLGPWQATAFKTNNDFNEPNYNPFGSPTAVTSTQTSLFDSNGIGFSGFVFIDYEGVMPPNNGASAINRCYASFHLAAPCDYALNTTITSNNTTMTVGTVALWQAGSALFTQTATGLRTGTLAVSDYELRILITGNSGGNLAFDGRTQIDSTFRVVPGPGGAAMLGLGVLRVAAGRRRAAR